MPRLLSTFVSLLIIGFAARAEASSMTIAWDPNTEPDVAGYVVAYGVAPGQYDASVDVGPTTMWTLGNAVDGRTYYFTVYAYNGAGLTSDPSEEVSGTAGPVVSQPYMNIDLPSNNAASLPDFVVAGWAADVSATGDSGVNAVHVWAYPNPGSGNAPVFLGAAQINVPRPDVGAAFGENFTNSGFALHVAGLSPGWYDVVVFAHSRVAGTFNNAKTIRIRVQARTSRPMMAVDGPVAHSTVSGAFTIGGWAIDYQNDASTSGVDAVHVWAYPASGAAPIFVGVAAVGVSRPDVGTAFGPAYSAAGYNLVANLPRGSYNLVVFAHSSVSASFNNAVQVPITVH
ncbi:MAG: fibronectin type III domain-containing protein [Acidobacteria bacterium]|nr:fibronectin type III domain-containing protein [Acidobacteriota bacterium]